jgi:hypothetical protein
MRLIRTWPRIIPAGRTGYVVDGIERLVIHRYDARAMVGLQADLIALEWDIAASKEDLALFADHARAEPDRVLVAPYRLYPEVNRGLDAPIWAHRREPGNVPVTPADPVCHRFGFGMIYLPRALLVAFAGDWLANNPYGNLSDETFSGWHYQTQADRDVPVCWDVRPVHLHYHPPTTLTTHVDHVGGGPPMAADQPLPPPSTHVVALLNKRQAHLNTGQHDEARRVEAELAKLGYDPDGNPKPPKESVAEQRKAADTSGAPQGRTSRPRQTTTDATTAQNKEEGT